ncbi:MAG: hypothetical protein J2P18_06720 [Nocardia sp.]|nr:hypothetical protein [Nocardia sp.]
MSETAHPGPTDPEYISAMEHFESMPHEKIYAGTQRIDPAEILRASLTWLEGAATLTGSIPITRSGTELTMDQAGWRGAAADAAADSVHSFAAALADLAEVFGEVGARLGAVSAAAETVKIAVAPPGDTGPVGAIARALGAAHVIDAQIVREVLRQEAVMAMNTIYKPAYSAAGTGVPALPAYRDPGAHTPAPAHTQPPHRSEPEKHTPPAQYNPPSHKHPAPTPEPAPSSPEPPTSQQPAPPESPAPAPSNPAPAGPPLGDQDGQPGVTGPVPDTTTRDPGQPGVSPPH